MPTTNREARFSVVVLIWLSIGSVLMRGPCANAQVGDRSKSDNKQSSDAGPTDDDPRMVLTRAQWNQVDDAVQRALDWLARSQEQAGSFPTLDTGQPAVTSLCILAFAANGNLPSDGSPHGEPLQRALDYVLDSQKQNGLIARMAPDGISITRAVNQEIGVTTAYNHAISALALAELYGMGIKSDRLETAIINALKCTLEMQGWPKDHADDKGGWRYINDFGDLDSDVSITGWQLMFLRSARNAGFEVPKESMDSAVGFIRRAFSKKYGTFTYNISPTLDTRSRAMAGAGILALAHAGLHETQEAHQAGEWLLRQKFDPYNRVEPFTTTVWQHDRYHYSVFFACQGTYQLGGRYWKEFFPRIVPTLLKNQQADGAWAPESHPNDGRYGNAYTTALMLLSLGAPNQLLPIFQR